MTEAEVTNEQHSLEDAIGQVEAEAQDRPDERLPASDEPASDPLAELARLIGQTNPFDSRRDDARYDDALYGAVHPLHRHPAQGDGDYPSTFEPAYPSALDAPDLPAGPPSWLRRVSARMKETSEADAQEVFNGPPAPPIEVIPEQDLTAAIAFRPSRRGPLELLPDPPRDPHDPEQSQLYLRVRQQLQKLQADIPSQERAQIDDAIDDFLAQPASWQQVEFKKVLWLCGNALRNILAQHDTIKDDPEPHYSKLPVPVAEAMRRPVEAWNVFVLGDADLVELDAKRLGPREQQSALDDINAARVIVEEAAADRNITTEQTGRVLEASLHVASTSVDNINTRQARYLVAGTSRNLIVQLVRRAYLTCQSLAIPQNDEDHALVSEYRKGVARGVGTAAVGGLVTVVTFAAPHAASFFEFVAQHAAPIREYFAIAFQSPQLNQVIDTIEYVRLKLTSSTE